MPYVMKGRSGRWISEEEALTYALQPGEEINAVDLVLPAPTHAEMVESVLTEARVLRAQFFDLADGLQASYLALGNSAYATALETYKEGLRNATLTDLSGATTEAEMRAIIGDVYDSLKGALPLAIKIKFYQTLQ